MKNGLIYGAISGILMSVLLLLLHKFLPNLFFSPVLSLITMNVVAIIAMTLACRKEKQALGGSLKFGEGLLIGMIAYGVFSLIYTISMWALINFSPEAFETLKMITKTSTENMLHKVGVPEDQIFEQTDQLAAATEGSKNLSLSLINWTIFLLVPGGLLALLISGIISRKSKDQKIASE